MTDPDTAHARMVDELVEAGNLRSQRWIDAFRAVPRHLFLPRFFWHTDAGELHAVDHADPDWLARAYTVDALVTQIDNDPGAWDEVREAPRAGMPTSSSSDPGLMATMLEALDIDDGHRVLEIGAGTGYNAALLSERLGGGQVTTIEIDPVVAEQARAALRSAGYAPHVVTGDGTAGVPDRAPFDRIIATVGSPSVPAAWIEQTRPGGLILLNVYAELGGGAMALLTVHGGRAEGRFLADFGAFMPTRAHQPTRAVPDRFQAALHGPEGERSEGCLPADALKDPDFAMLAGLLVFDLSWVILSPDDGGAAEQLWLLGDDGSWAKLDQAGEAEQHGPRRLADELTTAHRTWERYGRPQRDRFGLTADRSGTQVVWLDDPRRPVPATP